jgi:hypothetical protein
MWKNLFVALAILVAAPTLTGCAASGAGSVGADEDGVSGSASGSATAGDDDASSTSKTTTR